MTALGEGFTELYRERHEARKQQAAMPEKLDLLVSRLRQFEPLPEGSWENDPYAREHQIGFREGWNAAVSDVRSTLTGLGL